MSGALVVFAKRPDPGQVKTRLCPAFSPEQAAAFYAAMLDDVLESSDRAAAALGLAPVLAVHPPEAASQLPAPTGWQCEPQQGPDLGARMEHALARQLDAGRSPVLLRGSDSPTLGRSTLAAALEALEQHDLVICPDRDGGYNLVGLHEPAPGLFHHPMSTAAVLEDTLANAARLGLHASVLAQGFDIDTIQDLSWLARMRREKPSLPCPRTLAFLDERGLWPDPYGS